MFRFFPVLLIFITGCQSGNLYIRAEYGYGSQWLIAKEFNDWETGVSFEGEPRGALPVDGHYLSLAMGGQTNLDDNVKLGLSVGPVIFVPTKGPDNEFIGVEAKPRLTYTGWRVQPYAEGLIGVGRTRHRWLGEGTHFQFSVGGSVGLAIPLDERWEIDFGYRFYHISNGSAIFNTPRPNVGYNTDMIYLGLQHNF